MVLGQLGPMLHVIFILVLWVAAVPARAQNLHLWSADIYLSCVTCPASDPRSACSTVGAGAPFGARNIFNPQGRYGNPHLRASPWNEMSQDPALPEIRDDTGRVFGVFTLNTRHPRAFDRAEPLAQVYRAAGGDLATVRRWMCHTPRFPSP